MDEDKNLAFLQAQEATLQAILADMGPEDVINKFSIRQRLDAVREEIKAKEKADG